MIKRSKFLEYLLLFSSYFTSLYLLYCNLPMVANMINVITTIMRIKVLFPKNRKIL